MTDRSVPKLGDIIEAYCARCRLNLDVSVAAVVDGAIKQVQCRTCGNFVAYKPPEDLEAKKAKAIKRLMKLQASKRKAAATSEAAAPVEASGVERERWNKLTDGVQSWHARPYDRHRTYAQGAFILHKAHGMGHVESSDPEGGTLIALFREGLVELPQGEPDDE